jgi:hypothetical protein
VIPGNFLRDNSPVLDDKPVLVRTVGHLRYSVNELSGGTEICDNDGNKLQVRIGESEKLIIEKIDANTGSEASALDEIKRERDVLLRALQRIAAKPSLFRKKLWAEEMQQIAASAIAKLK